MKFTIILVDKGLFIRPISPKGKHRLEDLRGFLKHEGKPISDDVLFSPVDYKRKKFLTY